MKAVQAKGSGWVEYKYIHPKTQRPEGKISYVESADGLVIGCGIYVRDPGRESRKRLEAGGVQR